MVDEKEGEDNIDRAIQFAIDNAADDPEFKEEIDNDTEGDENAITDKISAESTSEGDTDPAGSDNAIDEGSVKDSGTQPTPTETPAQSTPTQKVTTDDKGNFIDEAGKIVASAGAERRMYEKLQRSERSTRHFESETIRLQDEINQNQALNNLPKQYNLNEQEVGLGLHIINQLKTSPVEAGRWILQEVMKSGYNLQQILGDVEGVPSSSLDMGAISRLIDEKLSPITNNFQQQESVTQTTEENRRNAEQFVATHDYADLHLDAIVNLMKSNPQMSSERAYFEVRQYAQENGLDFTQPLGQQIEARRKADPNAQQSNQPNRVMPDGNSASTTTTQQPVEVNADDDWDLIINQSMSEAGMQ
ncbi:MAG: hypothetical protein BMS9Abin11_1792 [Gammaproteobacteria bacterium]|nr:MAG: hypothetical protein BMS9Abin11_1792 [Gammaproteobacteria bacterium]